MATQTSRYFSDIPPGADASGIALTPGGAADSSSVSDSGSFDATVGHGIEAYNEAAFRFFLGLERKRAELSSRPFLLLLVDLKTGPEAENSAGMDATVAASLFGGLAVCLRETDFIGWYRQGRVAGAVLTQHAEAPGIDISEAVGRRVNRLLENQLPWRLAERIQVRVYELPTVSKASN